MIDIGIEIYVEGAGGKGVQSSNVIKKGFAKILNLFKKEYRKITTEHSLRGAIRKIKRAWIPNVKKMFIRKGRMGFFQKWQELTPRWYRRKWRMGANLQILRYKEDAIYNGLMTPNIKLSSVGDNDYSFLMTFLKLPKYAIYHQRGAVKGFWELPKRTITRWDEDTYDKIKDIIKEAYKDAIKIYLNI